MSQIRTAKTFAASAQDVSAFRFFGKTATSVLSRRRAEITGRRAASITAGKSLDFRRTGSWAPHVRLTRLKIGLYCRCYGKSGKPNLFLPWAAIQTGSHTESTIKAKPSATREPAPYRTP